MGSATVDSSRKLLRIKSGPGKSLQFLSRVCTINIKELGKCQCTEE